MTISFCKKRTYSLEMGQIVATSEQVWKIEKKLFLVDYKTRFIGGMDYEATCLGS